MPVCQTEHTHIDRCYYCGASRELPKLKGIWGKCMLPRCGELLSEQPCGCHDHPTYGRTVAAGCPHHD